VRGVGQRFRSLRVEELENAVGDQLRPLLGEHVPGAAHGFHAKVVGELLMSFEQHGREDGVAVSVENQRGYPKALAAVLPAQNLPELAFYPRPVEEHRGPRTRRGAEVTAVEAPHIGIEMLPAALQPAGPDEVPLSSQPVHQRAEEPVRNAAVPPKRGVSWAGCHWCK